METELAGRLKEDRLYVVSVRDHLVADASWSIDRDAALALTTLALDWMRECERRLQPGPDAGAARDGSAAGGPPIIIPRE